MRRSDLVQHKEREKGASTRTSQIVFWRAAASAPRSRFARGHAIADRANATRAAHSGGIDSRAHARLKSNQHRVGRKDWIGAELGCKPEMLEKLVKQAPEEDFYLLRLISEHPRANAKTLNKLAKHPYGAISRECGAHPNADANTLTWLEPRPQPTALVSRSFQSQHAHAATAAVTRPPEAPRRKPSLEVKVTNSHHCCRGTEF